MITKYSRTLGYIIHDLNTFSFLSRLNYRLLIRNRKIIYNSLLQLVSFNSIPQTQQILQLLRVKKKKKLFNVSNFETSSAFYSSFFHGNLLMSKYIKDKRWKGIKIFRFFSYRLEQNKKMNSTDDIKYRTIALLDKIEPYYILILVTVGLIGNSISFGIFLSSRLKYDLF